MNASQTTPTAAVLVSADGSDWRDVSAPMYQLRVEDDDRLTDQAVVRFEDTTGVLADGSFEGLELRIGFGPADARTYVFEGVVTSAQVLATRARQQLEITALDFTSRMSSRPYDPAEWKPGETLKSVVTRIVSRAGVRPGALADRPEHRRDARRTTPGATGQPQRVGVRARPGPSPGVPGVLRVRRHGLLQLLLRPDDQGGRGRARRRAPLRPRGWQPRRVLLRARLGHRGPRAVRDHDRPGQRYAAHCRPSHGHAASCPATIPDRPRARPGPCPAHRDRGARRPGRDRDRQAGSAGRKGQRPGSRGPPTSSPSTVPTTPPASSGSTATAWRSARPRCGPSPACTSRASRAGPRATGTCGGPTTSSSGAGPTLLRPTTPSSWSPDRSSRCRATRAAATSVATTASTSASWSTTPTRSTAGCCRSRCPTCSAPESRSRPRRACPTASLVPPRARASGSSSRPATPSARCGSRSRHDPGRASPRSSPTP